MSTTTETNDPQLAELDKPIVTRRQATWILTAFAITWALPGVVVLFTAIEATTSGPFGDTFGTVNALFSAAAFGGIIYTILLQRRELKLQRHELELTRDQLRRSAEAQEKSEAALRTQAQSLLLAAQLNALVARIEVYNVQHAEARNDGLRHRLYEERLSLYHELDKLRRRSLQLAAE
jgi:hypothetical protein